MFHNYLDDFDIEMKKHKFNQVMFFINDAIKIIHSIIYIYFIIYIKLTIRTNWPLNQKISNKWLIFHFKKVHYIYGQKQIIKIE